MRISIRKWLAPPVFPGNEEKTRRASLLNAITISILLFLILVIFGDLLGGRSPTSTIIIDILFSVVVLQFHRWLRDGRISLVGIGLSILEFLVITGACINLGTIRTPTTATYLFVVIMAGMLFDIKGIFVSTIASSLAILGLILAENAGMLPQPDYTVTITQWVTYTFLFGLTGGLTYYANQITQMALARANKEIKERERVEVELRKLSRAVEQSPASVVITDLDGKIEYVNPVFTRVTGYSLDEAIGKNPRILKTNLTLPETHRQLWNSITAGKEWHGEFVNRKKDGSVYYESAAISPITDYNGVTTHYLAVKEDITERKHIEDTLVFLAQHRWVIEGGNFFQALARFLAEKLDMDYVCIDRLEGDGLAAQTVAIYFDGQFEDNVAYTLKDTPCGDVVGKSICCFPGQVRHLFPKDTVLQDMVAESYVGTTLWNSSGQAIGLIAVIGRHPLVDPHLAESVLRLVADSAAGELEHKRSEAALNRWANVFEHIEWGVSITFDSKRFEIVNPAYATMHGYRIDELVGKPIEMVYPTAALPDFYRLNQMTEEKEHHAFESTHLRKDGSIFPAQVNITVVKDDNGVVIYSIVNVQDITERKLAESDIRHLSSFAQLSPVPILETQCDGKVIFANQAALNTIGRAGLADLSAFLPLDLNNLLTIKENKADAQYNREVKIGNTIFEENLYFEPEFGNLRIYALDITERKRIEAALLEEHDSLAKRVDERTADLRQANVELAQSARHKDEFLASMSHELRTPLTGILGLTEALQLKIYGDLNEKELSSIHHIEESGKHLLSLINDILDLSKIDAGKVVLDIKPVSILGVCQSSLQMVKQVSQKKHIKVDLKIDYSIESIQADERRLKQILVNLLNNAVKFTPEGGSIGLEVTGDSINKRVMFIVSDTGIGIDPQDMERLFKPFVQLDATLARQYEGTGLGLSLVLKFVELHGGGVSVESEPGQGSRFIVVLPWSDPEIVATPKKPTATLNQADVTKPSSKSLVLLVDDNELYLNILSDLLVSRNYRVITGHNGEEGIRLTREQMPDVILMDIQMPVLNGIQAAQRIRSDEQISRIPIIALTALAMNGDREKCFQAGVNYYISKPVSIDELQKVIEDQLSLRKGEMI